MATADESIIIGKLRGMLGRELVFRHWDGKLIVSKAPGPQKRKASRQQAKTRERFSLATRYAKKACKNPERATAYQTALKPRQNVYSRALQDFITPPKVLGIYSREYRGQPGNPVLITATDDFMVKDLYVENYSPQGLIIEKGKATAIPESTQWLYTTTRANNQVAGTVIKAIAVDIPENEGSLEIKV